MAQIPLDHQSLFSRRVLDRNLPTTAVPEAHKKLLTEWASAIRDGSLRRRTERQIRGPFIEKFFVKLLGYQPFGSGSASYTVSEEAKTGAGSADLALGRFGPDAHQVLAPVELKAADTPNLDISMPGRHKSPVQQVWEYAMDTPHAKFLVLSNMLEVRLYAVGHTRRVYERFDLLDLADDPAVYHRFMRALSADQLLGGHTAKLLDESSRIEQEITRSLYTDYKRWRVQLITALSHANDLEPSRLIAPSQKLLDRVLFVAFAQQRGLLPRNTLQDVHNGGSAWAPQPRYENYKGLFRAVDKGLPAKQIPPYNGGLFAHDPLLDNTLKVPDSACDVFLEFSRYDFGREVSVYVLGHIFEQSITDIEELKRLADTGAFELQALEAQAKRVVRATSGARKEFGIVYTPEFVTAFVVDKALGGLLEDRRLACARQFTTSHQDHGLSAPWRAPTREEKSYAAKAKLAQPDRVVELAFWRAWQAELTSIKVCDPACGSGAFLVAAYDLLLTAYAEVNEHIAAITGSMEVFHADREILNSNLFGVDLNAESIEITKLSLWLKTASHGKPLESLESNLRVGNSLVSSADGGLAYDDRAFDWRTAFPDIVARGGFDVVIGNPPYVRMERLKAIKPYLAKRFEVASDRADLYCYFFELAIRLLRNGTAGGRLGFIASNTFFKTGSGEKLRGFLVANTQLECVVDFGDLQLFAGVTTYPAILIAKRSGNPDKQAPVRFLNGDHQRLRDLHQSFDAYADSLPQSRLGQAAWQFEGDALARLRAKLFDGRRTLKAVYGSPLFGIKTGLNEAFVVTRAERDAMVRSDPGSNRLLLPFLEGKDLKKWHVESRDLWLIYTPKSGIDINDYPAIRDHLARFRPALEQRATKQAWFELQQPQEAYRPLYQGPKVSWGRFQSEPLYHFDADGVLGNDNVYCLPKAGFYEVALLNSAVMWFVTKQLCPPVSGGFYPVRGTFAECFPIPDADDAVRNELAALAEFAQTAATQKYAEIKRFCRQVQRDLVPGGLTGGAKLPTAWGQGIPEFADLLTEIGQRYKRTLSLKERNDWDEAISQASKAVDRFSDAVSRHEQKINGIVGTLFGLTESEIALINAAT